MINNIVNGVLNQASLTLSDSRDKILVAAKKRAQEESGINVPSPQDLKTQLEGLALDSPNSLQKAEQIYNRNKNLLEKAINRLERSKEELQAVETKIITINERFDFLNDFIGPNSIIGTLIEVLQGLPFAIDAVLATQVTPVVSGTVIDKAGDFKKQIKDNLQKFNDIITSLPLFKNYFDKETEKLLSPLRIGIQNIQFSIDKLQELLDQLNLIYENFILSLNIPDSTTGDGTGETNDVLGGTTLQEYLSNPDNLNTVISRVIIPTTKIYFERRDEGPGTELRQTGIIEIPTN